MKQSAIVFEDTAPDVADFEADVLRGLAQPPRRIPPKHFYDRRGSELFERICTLPEYYLTRAETEILRTHAGDIAAQAGPGSVLIELGSGASRKVRLLMDRLRPAAYVGVDISRDFLLTATRSLAADYPRLRVHAACADLNGSLASLTIPPGRRVAFYPGSSIGNFEPADARRFLVRVRDLVGRGGVLIIGVDLKKDPGILNAAYNDSQGVTAEFNLNLLRRLRRELGARLDPQGFAHHAFYDQRHGRIEMHLVSLVRQEIRVNGACFQLNKGETVHTENSYKYSVPEFLTLTQDAGFTVHNTWTDSRGLFSLHVLEGGGGN